ncbi:serine hydrolase domain-containing protein [Lysobacter capsici]|uniref:serine hydrolase domain-containing protein n=1 Tax=Lysobacter capsici TaxID=435897 RepID=UPI001C00783E|nr:serine hydrolase [Lysobacter capsici]QWF17035.1 beta-lactamase family protein [Lysobacter capsici]
MAVAITAIPAINIGGRNSFATDLPKAAIARPQALEQAYAYLPAQTRFDAFVALKDGRQLAQWGEVDLPINTHSVRKSLLSGLYGIAVSKGYLRLDQTLAELGIDDKVMPLTAIEKSATVRDLLMSRSGIYIEAAGEAKGMKDTRPQRGSHRPGEFFYYNNWDFNVLGVIFERRTGMSIGQAFYEWIAKPTGMATFKPGHVIYDQPGYTEHCQFVIFMSAADLARFGMLYANGGRWGTRQVIPQAWVEQSTKAYSDVRDMDPFDAYGYLWWLDRKAAVVWADGWGGQFMIVDARRHLVVVSRNDTGRSLLQLGLFVLFDGDGWRSHHQRLHELMIEAAGGDKASGHQSGNALLAGRKRFAGWTTYLPPPAVAAAEHSIITKPLRVVSLSRVPPCSSRWGLALAGAVECVMQPDAAPVERLRA